MKFMEGLAMKLTDDPVNNTGAIHWGPLLAWGWTKGRMLDVAQWGYPAPAIQDIDDFHTVGYDAVDASKQLLEELGGIIRRPPPLEP
jgi:hypothetical protein